MTTFTYTKRSNAQRALKAYGEFAILQADRLIQEEDGKFYFDDDVVKTKTAHVIGDYVLCPHCKAHLDNGVGHHGQEVNGKRVEHAHYEWACLACGGEFGPSISRPRKVNNAKVTKETKYTIDKVREQRNGVKRPSAGTLCGKVWAALDDNPGLRAKDLPALADANGWNRTNVSCEFYNWRKFHGIKGRQ